MQKLQILATLLACGFMVGCQAHPPTATPPDPPPGPDTYSVAHLKGPSQHAYSRHLGWVWHWWWGKHHGRQPVPAPTPTPEPAIAVTTGLELTYLGASWDTATVLVESSDGSQPPLTVTLLQGIDLVSLLDGIFTAPGATIPDLTPGKYVWTVSLWQGGTGGTLVGEGQQELTLEDGDVNVRLSADAVPSLGLVEVSPATALPGATVALLGQGFSLVPGQNLVTLGGQPAEVLSATNTKLKVKVPMLAPGPHVWWVQVGGGMVGKTGFQVAAP